MNYVHSRYNIFIAISCVVSGLIIIAMIAGAKKILHPKLSVRGFAMLALPLLLPFFTRNMNANYSDTFTSAETSSKNNNIGIQDKPEKDVQDFLKKTRMEDPIELTEKNFVFMLNDIYCNPAIYNGKTIIFTGKVLKRKMAPRKDEFATIRMVMVCCAADMQPAGCICRYENAPSLQKNGWYRILGKLQFVKTEESEILAINVEKADVAEKPEIDFIYPF